MSYQIGEGSILDLVIRFRDDLKINIKTTNGSTASLDLHTQTLIEDIKLKLEGKEGFPSIPEKLTLFFAGLILAEGKTLSFYKIQDGATLFLDSVNRKKKQIFIKTDSKTTSMDFNPTDTVYSIKSEIEKIEGVPTFLQGLKFNNEELKNDKSLESYQIKEKFSLYLNICYQEMSIFLENPAKEIKSDKFFDAIKEAKDHPEKEDLAGHLLVANGKDLESEKFRSDCNIQKDSTL